MVPLLVALALAGTTDALVSASFSDDGNHFAYIVNGNEDGSGFPFARFAIHAVKTNATVAKGDFRNEEDQDDAVPALKKQFAKAFAKHNISDDAGKELYTSGTKTKTSFMVGDKKVEVLLRLVPDPAAKDAPEEWGAIFKVTLVVTVNGKATTVNPKLSAPNVNLSSVRLAKNEKSLAVLIKYDAPPGYEGLDRRFAAITTVLP